MCVGLHGIALLGPSLEQRYLVQKNYSLAFRSNANIVVAISSNNHLSYVISGNRYSKLHGVLNNLQGPVPLRHEPDPELYETWTVESYVADIWSRSLGTLDFHRRPGHSLDDLTEQLEEFAMEAPPPTH